MQAKCGCRILSLEMRRLVVFTRFWPRTFILGFIQTVMSSTASGLILYCINNRCTINSLYLELPCCVPVRCISPSFLLMSKHVILISPAVSNPFYWSRPLACATFDGVCKHSWTLLHITHILSVLPDGWTKADLVYVWKDEAALQFADNLSLPGGFILGTTGNQYCDVKTATGRWLVDVRLL